MKASEQRGDTVVITAGVPIGKSGTTFNLIKAQAVERDTKTAGRFVRSCRCQRFGVPADQNLMPFRPGR